MRAKNNMPAQELLFRGQTRRKGERVRVDGTPVESNWVFGGIPSGGGDFSVIHTFDPVEKFFVYADTFSLYINLKDKNDKKAFTGDITVDGEDRRWVIFACPGGYAVCRDVEWSERDDTPCFIYAGLSDPQNASWFSQTHEIIGNVFDNPELIEGCSEYSLFLHAGPATKLEEEDSDWIKVKPGCKLPEVGERVMVSAFCNGEWDTYYGWICEIEDGVAYWEAEIDEGTVYVKEVSHWRPRLKSPMAVDS